MSFIRSSDNRGRGAPRSSRGLLPGPRGAAPAHVGPGRFTRPVQPNFVPMRPVSLQSPSALRFPMPSRGPYNPRPSRGPYNPRPSRGLFNARPSLQGRPNLQARGQFPRPDRFRPYEPQNDDDDFDYIGSDHEEESRDFEEQDPHSEYDEPQVATNTVKPVEEDITDRNLKAIKVPELPKPVRKESKSSTSSKQNMCDLREVLSRKFAKDSNNSDGKKKVSKFDIKFDPIGVNISDSDSMLNLKPIPTDEIPITKRESRFHLDGRIEPRYLERSPSPNTKRENRFDLDKRTEPRYLQRSPSPNSKLENRFDLDKRTEPRFLRRSQSPNVCVNPFLTAKQNPEHKRRSEDIVPRLLPKPISLDPLSSSTSIIQNPFHSTSRDGIPRKTICRSGDYDFIYHDEPTLKHFELQSSSLRNKDDLYDSTFRDEVLRNTADRSSEYRRIDNLNFRDELTPKHFRLQSSSSTLKDDRFDSTNREDSLKKTIDRSDDYRRYDEPTLKHFGTQSSSSNLIDDPYGSSEKEFRFSSKDRDMIRSNEHLADKFSGSQSSVPMALPKPYRREMSPPPLLEDPFKQKPSLVDRPTPIPNRSSYDQYGSSQFVNHVPMDNRHFPASENLGNLSSYSNQGFEINSATHFYSGDNMKRLQPYQSQTYAQPSSVMVDQSFAGDEEDEDQPKKLSANPDDGKVPSKLFPPDAVAHLEATLSKAWITDKALIGFEYMVEIQHNTLKYTQNSYFCVLCNFHIKEPKPTMTTITMALTHVKSMPHKTAYLTRHFPNVKKKIVTRNREETQSGVNAFIETMMSDKPWPKVRVVIGKKLFKQHTKNIIQNVVESEHICEVTCGLDSKISIQEVVDISVPMNTEPIQNKTTRKKIGRVYCSHSTTRKLPQYLNNQGRMWLGQKSRMQEREHRSEDRKSRSSSRDRKSRSRDRKLRSRDKKSPSRDRKSPSRDRKSPSRDRKSPSRDRKLRLRDRESRSRDRKLQSRDKKSRSQDRKSRSRDRKSPTRGRNFRSRSRVRKSRSPSRSQSRNRRPRSIDRVIRSRSRSQPQSYSRLETRRSRSNSRKSSSPKMISDKRSTLWRSVSPTKDHQNYIKKKSPMTMEELQLIQDKKVKEYLDREEQMVAELKIAKSLYIEKPEEYPEYNIEWRKFYRNRCDVSGKNIDPQSLKKEWMEEFESWQAFNLGNRLSQFRETTMKELGLVQNDIEYYVLRQKQEIEKLKDPFEDQVRDPFDSDDEKPSEAEKPKSHFWEKYLDDKFATKSSDVKIVETSDVMTSGASKDPKLFNQFQSGGKDSKLNLDPAFKRFGTSDNVHLERQENSSNQLRSWQTNSPKSDFSNKISGQTFNYDNPKPSSGILRFDYANQSAVSGPPFINMGGGSNNPPKMNTTSLNSDPRINKNINSEPQSLFKMFSSVARNFDSNMIQDKTVQPQNTKQPNPPDRSKTSQYPSFDLSVAISAVCTSLSKSTWDNFKEVFVQGFNLTFELTETHLKNHPNRQVIKKLAFIVHDKYLRSNPFRVVSQQEIRDDLLALFRHEKECASDTDLGTYLRFKARWININLD